MTSMEVMQDRTMHVTRPVQKRKTKYQHIIADAVGVVLVVLMVLMVVGMAGYRAFNAVSI